MNDERIYIRVSKNEKQRLLKNAANKGKTLKEYLLEDKINIYEEPVYCKSNKKKKPVLLSISYDDLDKIDSYAKAAHLSRSAYLSKVGIGEKIVIIEQIKSFIKELNHIGNNLNQLTMLAHQRLVEVIELDNLQRLLIDIKKEIVNLQGKH